MKVLFAGCFSSIFLFACGDNTTPADSSTIIDLSALPDLSAPDLAIIDQSASPDLTRADLATPPDLTLPIVWTARTSGTTRSLASIWGSSASDVYVVGEAGTILHSVDTNTWVAQPTGVTTALHALWGSGANDVYAVGDGGTILHGNGAVWTSSASGVTVNLLAIWGAGAKDIYAGGESGTFLHSTDGGATWMVIPPLATTTIRSGWGGGTAIWAAGDGGNLVLSVLATCSVCDGKWHLRWIASPENIQSIWATSPANLYLVSDDGSIRFSFDGLIWPRDTSSPATPLRGLWGSGENDIYAVGDGGVTLHLIAAHHGFSPEGSGTAQRLNSVWGSSASDVYTVGEGGTILHHN